MNRPLNLNSVPLITCLLVISLVASFMLGYQHDQSIKAQILAAYEKQDLYRDEAENYRDFIDRRLRIDELGSEAYLAKIEVLLKADQREALINEIINHREFFVYLLQDGSFFMTPNRYERWREIREQQINPLIAQLSPFKFGLKAESFGLSHLVSHGFVETSVYILIANLLLLCLAGFFIEPTLGSGRFVACWVLGSFSTSALYVLLSDITIAPLVGLSGPVALLLGMLMVHLVNQRKPDNGHLKRDLVILLIALLLFSAKLVWQYLEQDYDAWKLAVNQIIILVAGALIYLPLIRLTALDSGQLMDDENDQLDRQRRLDWAKAMDEISSLEFSKAQQRLEKLVETYPNDVELVGQLYRLAKLDGDSDTYWQCSRRLIDTAVEKNNHGLAVLLFEDIQKNAASKARARQKIEPGYYHKMMMIFVNHDDMNRAEKSFLFLELAGHQNIIKDACTLLMEEFRHRKKLEKSRQYQMLLERL